MVRHVLFLALVSGGQRWLTIDDVTNNSLIANLFPP
jgi:hypothetical protein